MLLGVDAEQSKESVLVVLIDSDTFFDELAEVCIPLLVGLRITLSLVVDQFDCTARKDVSKLGDETRVLVVLSGNV